MPSSRAACARTAVAAAALALCLLASASAAMVEPASAPLAAAETRASAVTRVGMSVSDLARSVAFFSEVLGFRHVDTREVHGRPWELLTGVFGARSRIARMALGNEEIELTEFLAPRGRAYPPDTRSNDRWFQHIAIVVADMERAYAHLRRYDAAHASTGPQRLPDWNPNAGGIEAFYFRGPDGHFLEAIAFPAGKGDPRWQAPRGEALFLGIDHTAIVVGDTERSLAFYRDGLGLDVVGCSENHGVEQEHLNNVFGARLRITTLKAPTGPGIELLEYLAPASGRPAPLDLASNDLAHWQTTVVVDRPESWLRQRHGGSLVTPDVVRVDEVAPVGGLLVRDPDGHGIRVIGRTPGPMRSTVSSPSDRVGRH